MTHRVDVHVGQRLRQRRWMIGASQAELAKRVGVKFAQLQKYETGKNRVSASRLWALAQVMGVPVTYFFDGLPDFDQHRGEVKGDLFCDKETIAIVRAYSAIPQDQRRSLLNLAHALGEVPANTVAKSRGEAA